MKTISEIQNIISSTDTYIPLLQRNYKWSRECASELAEDLWTAFEKGEESYQLNMITIYKNDKDGTLQILDGQQRLITLKLLLSRLKPKVPYLDFAFQRDCDIGERAGRQYFINQVLPIMWNVKYVERISVDQRRLLDNYQAMIVPLSFKTVYEYYCDLLNPVKTDSDLEGKFTEGFNKEIRKGFYGKIEKPEAFYGRLDFQDDEIKEVYKWCKEFQKKFSKPELEEDISNDEVRVSDISDEFQELWVKKVLNACEEVGFPEYEKAVEFACFILSHVEMLYHETTSEPIEEFLNINENKTRFVISDYIRANMISDNPIDSENLTEAERDRNEKNRKETLKLFAKLSRFLYADECKAIWDLIQKRYDDFEKHPDINRLKVVFCDKYIGTSTKNYVFDEELKRLRYFAGILEELEAELKGAGSNGQNWNTYNAVYMLLECKERYRFFSLFYDDDIREKRNLSDVVTRENRFCFFEEAYNVSKSSDDPWDLSYFLESQLYTDKRCEVKKRTDLPPKGTNAGDSCWSYVNRGDENDELSKCLKKMINKCKERV